MMTKEQLKMLVGIALSDSRITEEERKFIYMIGKAENIDRDTVTEMLNNPQPAKTLSSLTWDEKFEYLYNVVQVMKIDGKVVKDEVLFCENLAEKMGYKRGVIATLSSFIYQDPFVTSNREALKKKVDKFIK